MKRVILFALLCSLLLVSMAGCGAATSSSTTASPTTSSASITQAIEKFLSGFPGTSPMEKSLIRPATIIGSPVYDDPHTVLVELKVKPGAQAVYAIVRYATDAERKANPNLSDGWAIIDMGTGYPLVYCQGTEPIAKELKRLKLCKNEPA